MSHPRRLATALIVCAAASACAFGSGENEGKEEGKQTPPPKPVPALTEAQAKQVLARFAAQTKLARRRLDQRVAAATFTGSTLQLESTKYRIFRFNKKKIGPPRYGSVLAATPKFTGHPRWFFAAIANKGTSPVTRDIVVLVQDKPGGPWRAAYTPFSTTRTKGPLGPGIDVADYPDVVRPRDPTLALPPAQLTTALSDVVNRGAASPHAKTFASSTWLKERTASLKQGRALYRSSKWTGTVTFAPSRFPVYGVRTKSGGALVWAAVEERENVRRPNPGQGNGITWTHNSWGDLLRPFTNKSSVKQSLNSVERFEVLVHIPPKGKGKIRLLADRWAIANISGR